MATNVFDNAPLRNVGTSDTTVFTGATGTSNIILQLDIANVSLGARTASAWLLSGGNKYHIAKDAPIPVGGTLQAIYGQKCVVKAGESIQVKCDAASGVDVMCSILKDV